MAEQEFRVAQGCTLLTPYGPKSGGEIVTAAMMGNSKKSIESNIASGHIIPINVDEHGEATQKKVAAELQPGVQKGALLQGGKEGSEPSAPIIVDPKPETPKEVSVTVDVTKPINPADLADCSLEALNSLVAETSPGTEPFETREEAVAFLVPKPKQKQKRSVTKKSNDK